MIVFRKARRSERTLNDLDAYISGLGSEPIEWLEREVRRWGEFSYDDIEQLLAEGKLEDLELWRERYSKVINEIFAPMWIAAIEAGALKAARTVLSDSEDWVQSWLERHGAELVTNLSEETRKAIANVIISWRLKRLDPKIMARQIRPLIGLNERQVRANDKYRERVYENYLHMGEALARARSEKAALRYASKQHRFRAETIVHTELAFAYNQGAHEGVRRAIAQGRLNRCEMIWTTAGTNRVCGRCLELKDKSIGFTDEAGVQLPPLHPRCRCAIIYRETKDFAFDLQRFGGQRVLPKKFTTSIQVEEYFGTKWLEKLTPREKIAVMQYTGKAYEKINSYLRGELKNLSPSELSLIKRRAEEIENALSKFELKDNIMLYRQCGYEFLEALRGSRFGIYYEAGFWSTTAVEGSVPRGNVRMEILLNAGTGDGAWIKPLSLHAGENEFLINRGAYFRIHDMKRDGAIVNVKLSYLGRNSGRIGKMKERDTRTEAELEAWLSEGEYDAEDKFTSKASDLRLVETDEEFEAVVEMCIKNKIYGLSPEGIREFLSAPITYSGFDDDAAAKQGVIL